MGFEKSLNLRVSVGAGWWGGGMGLDQNTLETRPTVFIFVSTPHKK